MNVAYMSCDFGVPAFGTTGSAVHVQQVVRALRGLGHGVTVYSPNAGDAGGDVEGFRHLPLDGIGGEMARLLKRDGDGLPSHLRREWQRLLYAEQVQRRLPALWSAAPPDVIYERYSLFGYAGVELAQRLGVPHLLEVNAPLSQEAAKYRDLVLRETALELERRVLNAAGALFVVSEALAEYARSLGVPDERIVVSPTAADAALFHPDTPAADTRAALGIDGKRVVGFVGSLRPWHDVETVVDAVRELHDASEPVHLLVVGEGPQLDALRALDAAWLTCTGAVPHDDVPRMIAAMDVVVVPYAKDGDTYFSPIKLFEAMAAAKPVVGARIGQVEQLLVDGANGLLYHPGDAADLAARLRHVFSLPDRGAGLGAAAREAVLAAHTWEHTARRIIEVAQALRS